MSLFYVVICADSVNDLKTVVVPVVAVSRGERGFGLTLPTAPWPVRFVQNEYDKVHVAQ